MAKEVNIWLRVKLGIACIHYFCVKGVCMKVEYYNITQQSLLNTDQGECSIVQTRDEYKKACDATYR